VELRLQDEVEYLGDNTLNLGSRFTNNVKIEISLPHDSFISLRNTNRLLLHFRSFRVWLKVWLVPTESLKPIMPLTRNTTNLCPDHYSLFGSCCDGEMVLSRYLAMPGNMRGILKFYCSTKESRHSLIFEQSPAISSIQLNREHASKSPAIPPIQLNNTHQRAPAILLNRNKKTNHV